MYSEKVMDHFQHPRNVGEIENASVAKKKIGTAMAASTVMLPFFRVDADALPVYLDLYMLDNKGISLSEFIESFSFHFFCFQLAEIL